jgi:hypothetical protein
LQDKRGKRGKKGKRREVEANLDVHA